MSERISSGRRNTILLAGTVLAVAVWFFALGPRQLGGPVAYVITSGNSMEPGIHNGDLVLARSQGSYDVGDVVAYHSPEIRRTVLHRIVGLDGDAFLLQGDNNTWVDAHHPRVSSIQGKLWIQVPGVGKFLGAVRSPIGLATTAGAIALALAGRRRRAARREITAGAVVASPPKPSRPRVARAALDFAEAQGPARWLGAGGVGCVVIGLALFMLPASRAESRELTFFQEGRFDYGAAAATGSIYEHGGPETGDPIYRALVGRFDVSFAYTFRAEGEAVLVGTGRLDAELGNDFGWQRSFSLQGQTAFRGKTATVTGTVDSASLAALTKALETETGTTPGKYRLKVRPVIEIEGTLAGEPVEERFAPELSLHVDDSMIRLDDGIPADQNPLEPSDDGSVTIGVRAANALPVPVVKLPLAPSRMVFLALGAGLLAGAIARRRPMGAPEESEADRIERKYGCWLMPVESADVAPDQVVRLSKVEALVRIAERFESPILHEANGGAHTYAVRDGVVWYCYRIGSDADREVVEPPPAVVAAVQQHDDPLEIPDWLHDQPVFLEDAQPEVEEEPEVVQETDPLEIPDWLHDQPVYVEEAAPEEVELEPDGVVVPMVRRIPEPARLEPEEEARVLRAAYMGQSREDALITRLRVEHMLDKVRREEVGRG
ncbi:MAG: signal peptidase I [Actinobacteria bacterium]|nr:signal peptidase I [Actinomycetota bacterium]